MAVSAKNLKEWWLEIPPELYGQAPQMGQMPPAGQQYPVVPTAQGPVGGRPIGSTGAGEDGIVQPGMPSQMVQTQQGPQLLHEGETLTQQPGGAIGVQPNQATLAAMQARGMPGMATGGTYQPMSYDSFLTANSLQNNATSGVEYGKYMQNPTGYTYTVPAPAPVVKPPSPTYNQGNTVTWGTPIAPAPVAAPMPVRTDYGTNESYATAMRDWQQPTAIGTPLNSPIPQSTYTVVNPTQMLAQSTYVPPKPPAPVAAPIPVRSNYATNEEYAVAMRDWQQPTAIGTPLNSPIPQAPTTPAPAPATATRTIQNVDQTATVNAMPSLPPPTAVQNPPIYPNAEPEHADDWNAYFASQEYQSDSPETRYQKLIDWGFPADKAWAHSRNETSTIMNTPEWIAAEEARINPMKNFVSGQGSVGTPPL